MPRTVILSERHLTHSVGRACFFEAEDVFCAIDDAELIAPEPGGDSFAQRTNAVLARMPGLRSWRVEPSSRPAPLRLEQDYDLLFVLLGHWSGGTLGYLDQVSNWRKRSRFAVCWVHEVWRDWLAGLRSNRACNLLRQFDMVICGLAGSTEMLSELIQRDVTHHPGAVDVLKLQPTDSVERTIDVYNMGRRGPAAHAALLEWAERRRRFYLYDTLRVSGTLNAAAHRRLLAEMLKRTKYFIAGKARADSPHLSGKQEEPGIRFFEGAAAGTMMVGHAPRTDYFKALFDWPDAVTPLDFDSAAYGDRIDDLDGQPERVARARRANMENALRRFDWCYAWEMILAAAGLNKSPHHAEREHTLMRRADALANGSA